MHYIGWASETPDLFSAAFGDVGSGIQHYLVVEALPSGGWDWVVWADDGSGESLHGFCSQREQAIVAAQHGASLLETRQGLVPVAKIQLPCLN